MRIDIDFPGGNIELAGIDGDCVIIRNQLRDTRRDWFYWAFRVRGAAGRTLKFIFDHKTRVGYHGAALSHDLAHWSWSGNRFETDKEEGFEYTFADDEDCVYFAHDMVYSTAMFDSLADELRLKKIPFAASPKGRTIYAYELGEGSNVLLLTARHHACESTGNYLLEGMLRSLAEELPRDTRVLSIPFVDLDGVCDGDQGKNRIPHDHNRDYIDNPIYDVCKKLMELRNIIASFDFHSPYHMGSKRDNYTYLCLKDNIAAEEAFSKYLKEAVDADPISFTYDPANDMPPNTGWNSGQTPTCSRYFASRASLGLAMTVETAYFGRPGNEFTQERGTAIGKAFGRAIRQYINNHDKSLSEK